MIRRINAIVLFLASGITIWRYLSLNATLSPALTPRFADFQRSPSSPLPGYGWWSGWDQGKYLEATFAWAHGNLDPALHWYFPGYSLFGALFVPLMPANPFTAPDLICLVASLWLFTFLAARLAGRPPYAHAIGAVLFVATSVLPGKALWAWVMPWTTTLETPCLLAVMLAAARFTERPSPADAFFAALAGVTIAAVRPADAAIVLGVAGAVMLWTLLRQWPMWRSAARIAAMACAGAAIPLGIFGSAYLAIYGLKPSAYFLVSNALGFEWRLLPIRWVTLIIDPMPLFPEGRGLADIFPWVAPGLAGMAACLMAPGPGRRLHVLVAATCLLDGVMLLIYRDLHPPAMWRFGNFHYFKWMLPIFGLYSALLLRALVWRPYWPAPVAIAAVWLGLFMWRAGVTNPAPLPLASSANVLLLPSGLSHTDDVVFAKARGDAGVLYGWSNEIRSGESVFRSTMDFKIFPWLDMIMVQPLRPLPDAPSTLRVPWQVTLDPSVPPVIAKQTLTWGWPCWFMPRRPDCAFRFLIPPAPLALGDAIRLGSAGNADAYLATGWSDAEPTGRWTDGPQATVQMGVAGLPAGEDLAVALTGYGYVPGGAGPTRVTAFANDRRIARWLFNPGTSQDVHGVIPRDAIGPGGAIKLDLVIANPRRPSSEQATSDTRDLGIFVEAITVTGVPSR